jgi:hypothetical protein
MATSIFVTDLPQQFSLYVAHLLTTEIAGPALDTSRIEACEQTATAGASSSPDTLHAL